MRNLEQYPVTLDEIIDCLETFKTECDPELIGDMRPLLLDMAIAAVQYRMMKLWERETQT
jgi:hypothetical protein